MEENQSIKNPFSRYERNSDVDIWELHRQANPECKEVLVIGGLFGTFGRSDNTRSVLDLNLRNILKSGVNVTIILQEIQSDSYKLVANLLKINEHQLKNSLEQVRSIYIDIKQNWDSQKKLSGLQSLTNEINIFEFNLFSWEFHGIFTDLICHNNLNSKTHIVRIYQLLRAQFQGRAKRYEIIEYLNKNQDLVLLDESSILNEKFLEKIFQIYSSK
ncbi:hypothetical protein NIES2111_68330 (plasmid) [Nostoc sp. NIES-2111]|nr:hypothetical protein NIES2111_68330 [Nostoc sp. NIES-2111]